MESETSEETPAAEEKSSRVSTRPAPDPRAAEAVAEPTRATRTRSSSSRSAAAAPTAPAAGTSTAGTTAAGTTAAGTKAAGTKTAGTSTAGTTAGPAVAQPTAPLPTAPRPTAPLPTTPPPAAPRPEPVGTERRTTELRGQERGTEYRAGDVRPAEVTVPTNIYRARRPAVAVLLIIPAIGIGLLLLRALAVSAFGGTFAIAGVIASVCALVALPLIVAGLYGLVTGAAHGAEHYGFKVWARPPLAYLVIGLVLVLTSGLAIR